uniref:Uncharacterized protein n=1 Tax=Ananas comosus var. bracteatus TaxID=296719 RepID=A0A6V7QIZ6_ANACO|nr:unnamed protein product [Ananas comosus var. bracteatus]
MDGFLRAFAIFTNDYWMWSYNGCRQKNPYRRGNRPLHKAGVSGCSKSIGNLLYMVATKCPTNALGPRPFLIRYIVSSKIKNSTQLDAALSFLSNAGLESFELDKFEEACGDQKRATSALLSEEEMNPFSIFLQPEENSKVLLTSLKLLVQVTYTSDYFQGLYDLAGKLIKQGLAYVDHQDAVGCYLTLSNRGWTRQVPKGMAIRIGAHRMRLALYIRELHAAIRICIKRTEPGRAS